MILNLNQPTSFLFLILGSLSNEDGDGHVNGKKAIGLGPVHKYPYSLENATFFSPFSKKNSRALIAFWQRFRLCIRTRWIDLKMITYPIAHAWRIYVFAIMSPRNNKLAPSLNFFGVGLYRCDVFHWCPKTMKRRSCWCPKPIFWEVDFFLMQTLSSIPINLNRCWPREWKHSIKDKQGKRPSATLNKFLILHGEDWNW